MLCSDGVVIGTDSIITLEYGPNFPTVKTAADKIHIIGGTILAGAGRVGLDQRFLKIVEQGVLDTKYLAYSFLEDVAFTKAPSGEYGALLAFNDGRYQLCGFKFQDFQPRLLTDQLWFASMGCGQIIADIGWRFLVDLFGDVQPDVERGLFLTTWLLDFCIEASPGNLSGPVRIAVLQDGKARMLSDDQLEKHRRDVQNKRALLVNIGHAL